MESETREVLFVGGAQDGRAKELELPVWFPILNTDPAPAASAVDVYVKVAMLADGRQVWASSDATAADFERHDLPASLATSVTPTLTP
jgi:hypothetical protein